MPDPIPAAWLDAFADGWHSVPEGRPGDRRRAGLAAVRPLIDAETREHIARDIDASDIEDLCRISYDAYEHAAAGSGWETNPASRVAWGNVPEANKVAMRAAVAAVATAIGCSIARGDNTGHEQEPVK
jgi:hypothetical protein